MARESDRDARVGGGLGLKTRKIHMPKVEFAARVEAPADVVWNCFRGPDRNRLAIGTYAQAIQQEGEGVGSIKTTVLLGGGVIKERFESIDEKERHWTYRVIDNGPLPFTDYIGEVRITPCGPDACAVKFQATFTPLGTDEGDGVSIYKSNCLKGIARLKEILGLG
jgi:hypothetical protein